MKTKATILILAAAATIAMTSCKSNEANYRKAYETTKEAMKKKSETDPEILAKIEAEKRGREAVVNGDSIRVKTEFLTLVDGQNGEHIAHDYGVCVGMFKQIFNARKQRDRLKQKGNDAYIVKNNDGDHYVIMKGFDNVNDAAAYMKTLSTGEKLPIEPFILSVGKY